MDWYGYIGIQDSRSTIIGRIIARKSQHRPCLPCIKTGKYGNRAEEPVNSMLDSMFVNLLRYTNVVGGTHVPMNCHMKMSGTKAEHDRVLQKKTTCKDNTSTTMAG